MRLLTKGDVGVLWNRFKPSSKIFLLTVPRRFFFCGSFVLFKSCVCHAFASIHCRLVVTWRERSDLATLVCDVYCDFVISPFGILGQVWYLIVSIPDPCCLSNFYYLGCPIFKPNVSWKKLIFLTLNHSDKIPIMFYAWIPRNGATC